LGEIEEENGILTNHLFFNREDREKKAAEAEARLREIEEENGILKKSFVFQSGGQRKEGS
jgi:hypothetical protein